MSEAIVPTPPNDAGERREAILRQLDQILASRLFRHSKRCGPLLHYVVTEALEGRAALLKERAIGVDVFGRKLDYDTAADPIVRTTASEVRKRIAQFYHENGSTAAVWIDLAAGSYVPEFRLLDSPEAAPPLVRVPLAGLARTSDGAPLPARVAQPGRMGSAAPAGATPRRWRWLYLLVALPLVVAGIWYLSSLARNPQDEMSRFWGPVWRTGAAIITIGGGVSTGAEPVPENKPPTAMDALNADRVGFVDAAAVASVAGLFRERGKQLNLRRGGMMTLEEMRRAPVVLIGSNNPWTIRLLASQRFYIEYGAREPFIALRDRWKPEPAVFRVDLTSTTPAEQTEGYAVISRFTDRITEQPVIILAGLGREGTTAAAEFVTQQKYLRAFEQRAPRDWARKNLQIVLSTEVVNSSSGPPRIVAIHQW